MTQQKLIWNENELKSSLPYDFSPPCEELATRALLDPVVDLLTRPSKLFRADLVRMGARLARPEGSARKRLPPVLERKCELAAHLLEALHAGSLMIDDVQDGSSIRRGKSSVHITYGKPLAINAGGWLYFWPLTQISRLDLNPSLERDVHRDFARVMAIAHCGQAIDLGANLGDDVIPQQSVNEVYETSVRLKTGALMGLAIRLGAILGGARNSQADYLERLGVEVGKALQALDDAGNFVEPGAKRLEDLRLGRPSLAWSTAARITTPTEYRDFVRAARMLPDESFLKAWVEHHGFVPKLRAEALERSTKVREQLHRAFADTHPRATRDFLAAIDTLEKSYD